MLQRKVCLLGAYAVGKTSLVSRFVHSIFSDKYHTTIGVKIDRKIVEVSGRQVKLMLWDVEGEDHLRTTRPAYLRGAAGYILVADGTRIETMRCLSEIYRRARAIAGPVPCVVAINKVDLEEFWHADDGALDRQMLRDADLYMTSAKTGRNVEAMLLRLAERMTK